MTGLGQSVYEDGIKKGIKAFVLDKLEDDVSTERIVQKLQKHFGLTEEASLQYFKKFSVENE